MKKTLLNTFFTAILLVLATSCSTDDIRNIAGTTEPEPTLSTEVNPFDINTDGFDFLEKIQGDWQGPNRIIADDHDWFAFDFRANSPSQVTSIFEGGSMGNLFTQFFVTDFKNKRTIMARNGGVLNGIYRTSYFVLDKVENRDNGKYFRFVDAKGGAHTMFMEMRFTTNDSLYFNAYTSKLGLQAPATRHLTFKGKRTNFDLAQTAAQNFNYPQNVPAWDFSEGFTEEFLYVNPSASEAQSATFLAQAETEDDDVFSMAFDSGDPWRIDQQPNLGYLLLNVEQTPELQGKNLFVNLSKEPLTDEFGYFVPDESAFNSILLFSELNNNEEQFLFTYVHPGTYHVNITADINEDGFISPGDVTHANQTITITPEGQHEITITNINVEN